MKCYVMRLPGGGMARAALCDFPVMRVGTAGTCDAPMCEDHRHPRGPTVDHCPDHVGKTPEA